VNPVLQIISLKVSNERRVYEHATSYFSIRRDNYATNEYEPSEYDETLEEWNEGCNREDGAMVWGDLM